MRKPTVCALLSLAVWAAAAAGQDPKPADSATQQPAEAAQPEVPAATAEQRLTGSIETGFRWLPGQAGNFNVYRSVVNLGEGPRLTGGQLRWVDSKSKYLDRIDFNASAWGGDPYNTSSLEVEKSGLYDFRLNYRNVAYFNNLPSFANPLLDRGVYFSQRALDMRRRQLDTELRVKPNSWISPYFAYSYATGIGRGISNFVSDGNEFPVSLNNDDRLNIVRGGVKFNFSKISLQLEQGGTTYRDSSDFSFQGGGNTGNRSTTLFGQTIILDQLSQPYRVNGDGLFSRGLLQGSPFQWLRFSGQFVFSQPKIDVTQNLTANGNLFLLDTVLPYTGFSETAAGRSQMPHNSASGTIELLPLPKLRIVESLFTDRYHVAMYSNVQQTYTGTATGPDLTRQIIDPGRMAVNYNQQQLDVFYEATPKITFRGGHRYVWGDAQVRQPSLVFPPVQESTGSLRRHVALAGFRYRPAGKLTVNADFEAAPTSDIYFRTGLVEYQKGRTRVTYQVRPSIVVASTFGILNNQDPSSGVQFNLQSREAGASVSWMPNGGRRFSILTDYTYYGIHTSILAAIPPYLTRQTLQYFDHGHHGGAFADISPLSRLRLSLGGSYSSSGGSRPVQYFQPQVRVSAPIMPKVSFAGEWRWYGFTEQYFSYEHFRTHLVFVGFRFEL